MTNEVKVQNKQHYQADSYDQIIGHLETIVFEVQKDSFVKIFAIA